jgi:hypothetical protein
MGIDIASNSLGWMDSCIAYKKPLLSKARYIDSSTCRVLHPSLPAPPPKPHLRDKTRTHHPQSPDGKPRPTSPPPRRTTRRRRCCPRSGRRRPPTAQPHPRSQWPFPTQRPTTKLPTTLPNPHPPPSQPSSRSQSPSRQRCSSPSSWSSSSRSALSRWCRSTRSTRLRGRAFLYDINGSRLGKLVRRGKGEQCRRTPIPPPPAPPIGTSRRAPRGAEATRAARRFGCARRVVAEVAPRTEVVVVAVAVPVGPAGPEGGCGGAGGLAGGGEGYRGVMG